MKLLQNTARSFFLGLLCILSAAPGAKAQPAADSFYLEGHISGSKTTSISIAYVGLTGESVKQTCDIKNGRFEFNGPLSAPTEITVKSNLDTTTWTGDPNAVSLIIEPAIMNLQLRENHFKEARLSGSPTQAQFDSLKRSEKPIQIQMAQFTDHLGLLNDSLGKAFKQNDSVRIREIMEKRKMVFKDLLPYQNQIKRRHLNFIESHPASYLSAYLLYYNFMNEEFGRDSLKSLLTGLEPPIQNSFWANKCRLWLNYKKLAPVGSSFLNLSGTGINNEKITTRDLIKNNAYTLVIFWASWCPPCRAMSPAYRAILQKYHAKGLNVVAITEDYQQKAWLAAIKKDGTSAFSHIFPDKHSELPDIYGLNSIPAEILLKGDKIIGKYLGASDNYAAITDLQKDLQGIFKNEQIIN